MFSADRRNSRNFKYDWLDTDPRGTHHPEFRRLGDGLDTEMFTLSTEGYSYSESTLHIQHDLRHLQTLPFGTRYK